MKLKPLYCSFCGKEQTEVKKLIAGPTSFICDECIDLCSIIVSEELSEVVTLPTESLTEEDLSAYQTLPRTDDAPPWTVLTVLLFCAKSWTPEARVIGNIRAGDVVRALRAIYTDAVRSAEEITALREALTPFAKQPLTKDPAFHKTRVFDPKTHDENIIAARKLLGEDDDD